MAMNKIRKGDEVIVRAGKDKGRRGTVLQVFDDGRVLARAVSFKSDAERHAATECRVVTYQADLERIGK